MPVVVTFDFMDLIDFMDFLHYIQKQGDFHPLFYV